MKIFIRVDGIGAGATSVRIAELRERVLRATDERLKDASARSDLSKPATTTR